MLDFNSYYQLLNPNQRQAVDSIDGPVMVIAGPGTGKTQVLTLRIANILQQTDTPAQAILALTFTDAAAANMRQRLAKLIGSVAYQPTITTFHSFCQHVMDEYPEYFSQYSNNQPLADIEKWQILRQLIDSLNLQTLSPIGDKYHNISRLSKLISDLKREGVSPQILQNQLDDFSSSPIPVGKRGQVTKTAQRERDKQIAQLTDVVAFYEAYQTWLTNHGRCDFDDLVNWVNDALRSNDDLLAEYQEKYLYILVDEYQDTNGSQNALVDILASFWGEQANLFVVGDPHQSIFRFQGASLENTWSFLQRYPAAKVIALQTGYRCPQPIYSLAHKLAMQADIDIPHESLAAALGVELESVADKNTDNETAFGMFILPDREAQYLHIASLIKEKLAAGMAASDMAVLVQTNQDTQTVLELLRQQHIPAAREGGTNILTLPITQAMLDFWRFMVDVSAGREPQTIFNVLRQPWFNLPLLEVLNWSKSVQQARLTWLEAIQDLSTISVKADRVDGSQEPSQFVNIAAWWQRMAYYIGRAEVVTLPTLITEMWHEFGVVKWCLQQPDSLQRLHTLKQLLTYVENATKNNSKLNLADFLQLLTIANEHAELLVAQPTSETANAVTVATLHKAKGREWRYVFLPNLDEASWQNKRNRNIKVPWFGTTDTAEQLADKRRLFYVGLTRAKDKVYLLYPQTMVKSNGAVTEVVPSIFWTEILENLPTQYQPTIVSLSTSVNELADLLMPPLPAQQTQAMKDFLQAAVANFSLSVSALNKYLSDPKTFWLEYVLHLPIVKTGATVFGTVAHTLLEQTARAWIQQQILPSAEKMNEWLVAALQQESLTPVELAHWQQRGAELIAYLQRGDIAWQALDIAGVEIKKGGVAHPIEINGMRLAGKIDRVDWLDKDNKIVRVVDYKTGKSKSDGFIAGQIESNSLSARERELPASIRGSLKRQLLFYKLLLDLDPQQQYEATQGELIFVSPSDKTEMIHRHLNFSASEVADLRDLLVQVVQEIKDLKGADFLFNYEE